MTRLHALLTNVSKIWVWRIKIYMHYTRCANTNQVTCNTKACHLVQKQQRTSQLQCRRRSTSQ